MLDKPYLSKMKTASPLQPVLENYPLIRRSGFSPNLYKQHVWIEYLEKEDTV